MNYWIILCNPKKWHEGEELYRVNDLLLNLDEEFWKINGRTVFNFIKVGDKGIIKVGNDRRSRKELYNNSEDIYENKLNAGIYATFEVVNDSDNKFRKKVELSSGTIESFVHIKIIKNFFKEDNIISKECAISILNKNTFETKSSKKISKLEYDKILLANRN